MCMYSSIFFIWNTASRRDPPHTALHICSQPHYFSTAPNSCSYLHIHYWEKSNYQLSSHFKAWRDLVQCSWEVTPKKFMRQCLHCPLLPTLPEVAPWHGGGHAASLPAAPHIPVFNEVLSKKFPHTSTESLLYLLTFQACCNLQCLVKTNRNILPPEHNLSEENSFRSWLKVFQGTLDFLEGRKTYSTILHATTTFALHMLTPEAAATINNQPICPIYFHNRVNFYHTGHVLFSSEDL